MKVELRVELRENGVELEKMWWSWTAKKRGCQHLTRNLACVHSAFLSSPFSQKEISISKVKDTKVKSKVSKAVYS